MAICYMPYAKINSDRLILKQTRTWGQVMLRPGGYFLIYDWVTHYVMPSSNVPCLQCSISVRVRHRRRSDVDSATVKHYMQFFHIVNRAPTITHATLAGHQPKSTQCQQNTNQKVRNICRALTKRKVRNVSRTPTKKCASLPSRYAPLQEEYHVFEAESIQSEKDVTSAKCLKGCHHIVLRESNYPQRKTDSMINHHMKLCFSANSAPTWRYGLRTCRKKKGFFERTHGFNDNRRLSLQRIIHLLVVSLVLPVQDLCT